MFFKSVFEERHRAPAHVLRISAGEILEIVKNGVKAHSPDAIFFNDDDFLTGDAKGRQRAIDFARLVIDAKEKGQLPRGLKFYMQTKTRSVTKNGPSGEKIPDQELLNVLAESGFVLVALGVESFSDRMLQSPSIDKKTESKTSAAAIEGLTHAGIVPLINIILLPPEAAEEDVLVTIREAMKYIREGIQVSINPFIEIYAGSPISLKKDNYPNKTVTINTPGGGQHSMQRYMLPLDPRLREFASSVWERNDRVLGRLKTDPRWDPKYLSQPVNAVINFVSLLEFFGKDEEAGELYDFIWVLVGAEDPGPGIHRETLSAETIGLLAEEDAEYADLAALLPLYRRAYSANKEVSERVRGERDSILRAITKILFNRLEVEKGSFTREEMEEFKELSLMLAEDAGSEETDRLLSLLNYYFGIKTPILKNNMLYNGAAVDMVPYGKVEDKETDIAEEFRGKKVLIFEEHHDDAALYIGAATKKIIASSASDVSLVTVISDPQGVTDRYAEKTRGRDGPLQDIDSVKKEIREEEGGIVAKMMGVRRHINLRVPCSLDDTEAFKDKGSSYYYRFSIDTAAMLEKLRGVIREQKPDIIIFGMPKGAYHQEHRDIARAILTVVHENGLPGPDESRAPVEVLVYPHAGKHDEFVAYGIRPNIIYRFGEEGTAEKQKLINGYASQVDRRPEYPTRFRALDEERAEHWINSPASGRQYAETLLRIRLVDRRAPAPSKAPKVLQELSRAGYSYINNRRSKLCRMGNDLIRELSATGKVAASPADTPIKREDLTYKISNALKEALKLAGSLNETEMSENVRLLEFEIKKGLDALEADSILASVILLARRAKRLSLIHI